MKEIIGTILNNLNYLFEITIKPKNTNIFFKITILLTYYSFIITRISNV